MSDRGTNEVLKRARLEAGLSQAALARLAGITLQQYNALERNRIRKTGYKPKAHGVSERDGRPIAIARHVAVALDCQASVLFPVVVADTDMPVVDFSFGSWASLASLGPEFVVERFRMYCWVSDAAKRLVPRYRFVVYTTLLGWKLREISVVLNVSKQRADQMRRLAVKYLRDWYVEEFES